MALELAISLGLPLKATPGNLEPRKLMTYMHMHMHIESKAEHAVSLLTNAYSRRRHSIDWSRGVPQYAMSITLL